MFLPALQLGPLSLCRQSSPSMSFSVTEIRRRLPDSQAEIKLSAFLFVCVAAMNVSLRHSGFCSEARALEVVFGLCTQSV